MARFERIREPVSEAVGADKIAAREAQGWRLVALEWERPAGPFRAGGDRQPTLSRTEVPYGLQVSPDFLHLEENHLEVEAMILMLDLMVEDRPLGDVADELNKRGFRTRPGSEWTQSRVFDLVPRLVETGVDIFGTSDWEELRKLRRGRLAAAV